MEFIGVQPIVGGHSIFDGYIGRVWGHRQRRKHGHECRQTFSEAGQQIECICFPISRDEERKGTGTRRFSGLRSGDEGTSHKESKTAKLLDCAITQITRNK